MEVWASALEEQLKNFIIQLQSHPKPEDVPILLHNVRVIIDGANYPEIREFRQSILIVIDAVCGYTATLEDLIKGLTWLCIFLRQLQEI